MATWHLTFSDLERSKSRSLRYRHLKPCKKDLIGHMLPSLIGYHIRGDSISAWATLRSQNQDHPDFEAGYLVKEIDPINH